MRDWSFVRLREVAKIERGIVEPAAINDGTNYVGLENIKSGGKFFNVRKVVEGELASTKFLFTKRHVLFGKLRPYLAKIALPDFDGICSTDIFPILPGDALDRRYLAHYLRQPKVVELASSLATGANLPRLSARVLEDFTIPIPVLNEQKRIAVILDQTEYLRAKRLEALKKLDVLTNAVFFEMFGHPSQWGDDWPMVRVDEAGRVQLGRQRAPKYQTGEFTKPYLRVANVFEDRLDLSDVLSMDFDCRDFDQYELHHGDILLNEGQSTELVGRPAMWRGELFGCCYQNTLVRFQADRARIVPEFALAVFLYYFRAGELAKISSKTSSVAHLGAARFSAMGFPVPPMHLQESFKERVNVINQLKSDYTAGLTQLNALFASIQHRAFRGEL